jgi:copper homeostasis protein (lipoprotein)
MLLACAGCATHSAAAADPPLLDTRWALVRLGDTPLAADTSQREPYLVLRHEDGRAGGSLGCNGMNGSYTLDGGHLHFGPLMSTKMACVKGMDVEQAFGQALEQTARWKISGRQLELLDDAGQVLAVLEARAAP